MSPDTYTRTISGEEAEQGYFMVLNNQLGFFPLGGTAFKLLHGEASSVARVESYPCSCRGTDKPHRHYFVRWNGLRQGDTLVVRKDPRKSGRYVLQVRSVVSQKGFCG